MKKLLTTVLICAFTPFLYCQQLQTISGIVREYGTQEQLVGVNIRIENTQIYTQSNNFGFYSLTFTPKPKQILVISYVGLETIKILLDTLQNKRIDFELKPNNSLEEVVVNGRRNADKIAEDVQMSKIDLPISQIKKLPTLLGEKDVFRAIQLLPGVQKGSEGQTGLYVRGGGPDQNLVILDGANVYNASHLFGFFSVFNGDALKSVELTKGGFPARYGGRLSSVLELQMKEGSREKFQGEGGIGLIASRINLEGPILNKKGSFLMSARRTYLDVVAAPLVAAAQKNQDEKVKTGYYFYDFNLKFNYDINAKNKVYLSSYLGKDVFYLKNKFENEETNGGLNWGNITGTARWNHVYNSKLFSNVSLITTNYQFSIYNQEKSKSKDIFSLDFSSSIRDYALNYDFDYYPNNNHQVKFGIQSILHRFRPNAIVVKGSDIPDGLKTDVVTERILESGLYAEDTWKISSQLKANYGIRLTNLQAIGRNFYNLEPRASLAYQLKPDLAIKASYANMNQYIHLLSNTGIGLPTDLWVPSTKQVKPQNSEQVALGIAKDYNNAGISVSLEGYYKKMKNIINYKEGASFLLIEPTENGINTIDWQKNITQGQGQSYGAELLIQKKYGKFNGWVGYTLSWIQWQFNELNRGQWYYPKYDRRHDLSLVGMYEISKRVSISATWVYGTGNYLNIPIGGYNSDTHNGLPSKEIKPNSNSFSYYYRNVNEFNPINTFRAEAYHRLDFGITFKKQKKNHLRTWEFSAYNMYSRKNPFFYQIGSDFDGNSYTTKLQKVSLFPIIPSFTYGFKF